MKNFIGIVIVTFALVSLTACNPNDRNDDSGGSMFSDGDPGYVPCATCMSPYGARSGPSNMGGTPGSRNGVQGSSGGQGRGAGLSAGSAGKAPVGPAG